MAEIADQNAAIAAEQAVITQIATDIEAVLAKLGTPGISPAEVAANTATIQAMTTALKDSASKIEAALTPATP